MLDLPRTGHFQRLWNEPCNECDGVGTLGYNLGSSELQATHMLIADREQGQVYVTPTWAGEQFLREQWPPSEPLALDEDAVMEALCQAMAELGAPHQEEVEQAMREAQERLEVLQQALDPDLVPAQNGKWQQYGNEESI